MNTQPTEFSDRLLALDPQKPLQPNALDHRAAKFFEQKLTLTDWLRLTLMGAGGLVGAIVCGSLAATEPAGMPTLTRVILSGLAFIGMFWAVLAGTIVRRGAVNSAVHGAVAANMGFALALTAAAMIGSASLAGIVGSPLVGLVLMPLTMLVLASVVLVNWRIGQAELRVRQKLLEVECRLALLAEGQDAQVAGS